MSTPKISPCSCAPGNCADPAQCPQNSPLPVPFDWDAVPAPVCRVIEELRLLYKVASTLQSGENLHTVLEGALGAVSQSLGLYRGSLRILNRAENALHLELDFGLPAAEVCPDCAKTEELLATLCAKTGEPHLVPDLPKSTAPFPSWDEEKWKAVTVDSHSTSLISVPVMDGAETFGTLACVSRSLSPEGLKANLRLLILVAQLVAQAVRLRQHAREQVDYLRQENERLQEQLQRQIRPENMIGNSRAMQTVYYSIEQVASSNTTVLIRGESGVGKELVAHALHRQSPRARQAFVKVNCAALPESIVESELFGHERGAFTGAIAMRKGRFELAHRGTIFLDEIGELPIQTQAKLLRVLQERELERVGGTETVRVDVRVIAATNQPLEKYVEESKFRQDLYYRINVFPIYVPALRERKTDILELVNFFIEKYSTATGKDIRRISTPAIDMLMAYHWPGNVRELENCIERAVILARDDVIHGYHLPPTLQMPSSNPPDARSTLKAAVEGFERELIIDALKAHHGNMAAAARQLGMTERIMGLRVKKYQIDLRRLEP